MQRVRTALPPPKDFTEVPVSIWDQEVARRKALNHEIKAEKRTAFNDFIESAWGVLEGPQRPFLPNWHIKAKADLLTAVSDGQVKRAMILEPPSYGKSLVTSVLWPAWDWGPNRRPDRRWLCTSYGNDMASPSQRDAERCRRLMQSVWYQSGWGTVFGLSETMNARSLFANDKAGYRISAGLDGSVPGQRADFVVIDDPTKPPDTPTQLLTLTEVKHAAEVWESTLRSRAWDDGAAVVLVMHRIHDEDLAGYFLKEEDGWTVLRLPALFEQANKCRVFIRGALFFEDPRTTEGQPLHPAREKATEETKARAISQPWIHAAQDQQHPAPLGGGMIHEDWMPSWTLMPGLPSSFPQTLDEIVIVVDCAFKDGEKNSFVVFQAWARRMANAYLLDQHRKHMDLPTTLNALQEFCARWPKAGAKYVEDKANGPGVVQMLRDKIPGLMSTSSDDQGDLCLKKFCMGSKEGKLSAVAPYFAAHNVFVPPRDTWWLAEYLHELTTFPKSGFDDQVDCTAMGVWKLLSTFAAHIEVGPLMQLGASTSPLAGLWETAYGSGLRSPGDVAEQAFRHGPGLADTLRGAFGR